MAEELEGNTVIARALKEQVSKHFITTSIIIFTFMAFPFIDVYYCIPSLPILFRGYRNQLSLLIFLQFKGVRYRCPL